VFAADNKQEASGRAATTVSIGNTEIGSVNGKEGSLSAKERILGKERAHEHWLNVRQRFRAMTIVAHLRKEQEEELGTTRVFSVNELEHAHPSTWPDYVRNTWLLLPNSTFLRSWHLFVVVLLIWSATLIPFRIGFYPEESLTVDAWTVSEIAVDIFFMIDIVVNFCSAYEYDNQIVVDWQQVALNYLMSYFWIDLAGSLPLSLIAPSTGS